MPKKIFVTRHQGAVDWVADNGVSVQEMVVDNFDAATVEPGDIVMGTLPVQVVAQVNARGGHYWHLSMSTPPQWRGRELLPEQMRDFGARLEEFRVTALGVRVASAAPSDEDARTPLPVHLCIATGQTLANLLPLRALPWRRVVVFTSADMAGAARRLQQLVQGMAPRADGSVPECELVALPHRLDWASLSAFAREQAQALGGHGPLDFNITGGSKLMTLAFTEAFRSQARLVYCSTQYGTLDVIDSGTEASLPLADDLLDLDRYLAAQGFRVLRRLRAQGREQFLPVRRREAMTASLVLGGDGLGRIKWSGDVWLARDMKELPDVPPLSSRARTLQGLLHELGSEAVSRRHKDGRIERRFRPQAWITFVKHDGVWRAVFEALKSCGLIRHLNFEVAGDGTPRMDFQFSNEEAAAYLGGGYLEEYALLCLASLDIPVDHYAGSIGIGVTDKDTPMVSDELNELDVAVVWRNQLLVMECKAGVQLTGAASQDLIHKLDQLKDNVGGTMGRAWFLTQRRLDPQRDADVLQRAALNGIQLVHGTQAMRDLGTMVAQRLGCGVRRPWPTPELVLDGLKRPEDMSQPAAVPGDNPGGD